MASKTNYMFVPVCLLWLFISKVSSFLVMPSSHHSRIGQQWAQEHDISLKAQKSKDTILITGANSGIGLEASKILASQGHSLVLACRSLDKAQEAKRIAEENKNGDGSIVAAKCDLASLKSIQEFVTLLEENSRDDNNINIVCLNAGIARNTKATDVARTVEGFEETIGINHLGHFYLTQLLLSSPKLSLNIEKIVVTASGVHDPSSPGGAQGAPAGLGTLEGLKTLGVQCEMIDGSQPYNADKAYKDSKLCNILFTRELQRRLAEKGSETCVNCFNPGLIASTGLLREQNPIFITIFDFAARRLLGVGETPEWGGKALVYMTTVDTKGKYYSSNPGSSKFGDEAFGEQFVEEQESEEARDDEKARDLWDWSEKLLQSVAPADKET